MINDRSYRFEYEEQLTRTIITIHSDQSTEQDTANIKKLGQLLAQTLQVHIDSNSPQRLFVQRIDSDGKPVSVSTQELKAVVRSCLDKF